MAPKRKAGAKNEPKKAEETSAEVKDDPPEKKSKTDAEPDAEAKPEAAAAESREEEPKEKELDAPDDKRPTLKEAITFDVSQTTINLVQTTGGRLLTALSDGGMQYLLAGARASVGAKSGRYMFEVRIIEVLSPAEPHSQQGRSKSPLPRQLVRVGFSAAGSSLLLGDGEGGVCFDSEGFFHAEKKRSPVGGRFGRDQVAAVLLNLDPKSPNANTISFFRDGVRVSPPQAIPEGLKGKPLFPHVTFRNVSLQVNFGPKPVKPLDFKCRSLQGAASQDVIVSKPSVPKDGKYDLVFPVGFPDQGTFAWLDSFLSKNPHYMELSDRAIVEWAQKSGLWKPKGSSWKNSNDKPDFNFGLPLMDDHSAQRTVFSMAAVVPRHYVIMQVKSNLIADERKAYLDKFTSAKFRKIAHVVMGEPNDEFKALVHKSILDDKRSKAEVAWRQKKLDKEKKKLAAERQRQAAERHKKAVEARKKLEAERKSKADATKAATVGGETKKDQDTNDANSKEAPATGEKAEGAKEEEKQQESLDEPKEDQKEKDKEEGDEEEGEEEEEDPLPEVELTEEEKKLWFKPAVITDLTTQVLNSSFANFSIPEKEEGFDEIKFEWEPLPNSKEYLKNWVLERKRTSRIEDLLPGEWFKTTHAAFKELHEEWQKKQKEFKASKRKAKGDKKDEEDEEEGPPAVEDIFSLDNVCDVGTGEPLFAHFTFEDWALVGLRSELHLLAQAFKKDVDDPDRPCIPEQHLAYYYSKYYRKQLNPKAYGKTTIQDLLRMVSDTVSFEDDSGVIKCVLGGNIEKLDIFVKVTEEGRRERQRRIDAGDETARLKFSSFLLQPPKDAPQPKGSIGLAGATYRPGFGPGGKARGKGGPPGITHYAPKATVTKWRGGK